MDLESDVSFPHKNRKINGLDEGGISKLDENVERGGGLGLCIKFCSSSKLNDKLFHITFCRIVFYFFNPQFKKQQQPKRDHVSKKKEGPRHI